MMTSQVNEIFLEAAITWFGCRGAGQGSGSMYVLPAGNNEVFDYRKDSPGVRFVCGGILFRNFDVPHTPQHVERHPVCSH